jgi:hypothetical protein
MYLCIYLRDQRYPETCLALLITAVGKYIPLLYGVAVIGLYATTHYLGPLHTTPEGTPTLLAIDSLLHLSCRPTLWPCLTDCLQYAPFSNHALVFYQSGPICYGIALAWVACSSLFSSSLWQRCIDHCHEQASPANISRSRPP